VGLGVIFANFGYLAGSICSHLADSLPNQCSRYAPVPLLLLWDLQNSRI
jgi:hypothetical protein